MLAPAAPRRWTWWVLLLSVVPACKSSSTPTDKARPSAPAWRREPIGSAQAIPPGFEPQVERSLKLGRQLFLHGTHASDATSFLFAEKILPADQRIRGWVVLEEPTGMVVDWLGENGTELRWLYRVRFSEDAPTLERHDEVASVEQQIRFAARKTAREAALMKGIPSNAIVLSSDDQQSWWVYLFYADLPGKIGVGSEERIVVSRDGRQVFQRQSLAPVAGWLLLDQGQAPVGTEGAQFSHPTTPWPLETHVRVSLLHQTRLLIDTSAGLWSVQGGAISFHGGRASPLAALLPLGNH